MTLGTEKPAAPGRHCIGVVVAPGDAHVAYRRHSAKCLDLRAAGAALMIAALLGSVLGRSSEGRKAMKIASIGLSVLSPST
jgi:hypothetical protein